MKIYMKIWMIASVVFFSSCNEWLDVKQEGEFEAESLYADGEGYRAVINKLYKMMAESTLYGENLTYGMVDCMSQQYALTEESNTNSVYRAFADFKYTDNGVPEHIDAMWLNGYRMIANANDLLQRIQNAGDDIFKFGAVERNLITGEALACRALVHFEFLRLFAPRVEDAGTGVYVPYVEDYPNTYASSIAVEPFLEKVIYDLTEAKRLVAEYDTSASGKLANATVAARMAAAPINNFDYDNFFAGREYRLSYYSITALLARVYQWAGMQEEALACAREVIGYAENGEPFYKDDFTGVKSTTGFDASAFDQKSDYKISSNIIFACYDRDAYEDGQLQYQFKHESENRSNVFFNLDVETLFNSRGVSEMSSDVRYRNMIFLGMGQYPISGKYYLPSTSPESAVHLMMFPVIRLTEMHYIVAEYYARKGQFTEAYQELNDLRATRGLEALTVRGTFDEFVTDLVEDARREWISEGQLFYLYKRLDASYTKNGVQHQLSRAEALLPVPSDQTNN